MESYGLLIDYGYCTGCHTCTVACQMENEMPIGQTGIKVFEVGPWHIEGDKWQLSYIPVLTDQCTLCNTRVAKGKQPSCVKHCQAAVMKFGKVSELSKEMEGKPRYVMFTPK